MLLLSLETSGGTGGLCISRDHEILFEKTWERERSQSEFLTLQIAQSISDLKLDCSDFDAFAVNQGPGSFTGIRIGLSIIKTLSYLTQKPVISCNSLEIAVQSLPTTLQRSRVVLTGFRNLLYTCDFEVFEGSWQALNEVHATTWDTLPHDEFYLYGSGLELFEGSTSSLRLAFSEISKNLGTPSVSGLQKLAFKKYKMNGTSDWNSLVPLYVRDSEAEEKLRSGQLKPFKGRPT